MSPSRLNRPDPPALLPPDCHSRSVCLPLQHVINQYVWIPPSITCHQPICLNASLYNMSSTNQSVSVPPYTICHLPKCMDTPYTTSHQPQCLHTYHDKCHLPMYACLPLYHVINQCVCSLTCQQPTFCIRLSKMCHQINSTWLHL